MKYGPPDADVVVIGAGVAGMCAALAAAPRRVLIVCAEAPAAASSSALAQGGIAAPVGPGDSVADHVADTLAVAGHAADPRAAEAIISRAPATLSFLEAAGVAFDRDGARFSLHREAGHGRARVAHAAGDRSGAAIVDALWAQLAEAAHVEIAIGWRVVDLMVGAGGAIAGAVVAGPTGALRRIGAVDTVLATGGLGGLFRYTTNGRHAAGDGLAMALAAGARVAALEFVQFHPTALRVDTDPLPLLTEALRGAGARLVTTDGREVMAGRHALGDLAPRDVVSRAVWEVAQSGSDVRLDATRVFAAGGGAAFPGTRALALSFGIDPAVQPLPVTAAAHYHMGGIVVDPAGRTSLPGLWACGEVAFTGLHGANRLASNSLLEAVVCGRSVGTALAAAPPARHAAAPGPDDGRCEAPETDARWPRLRERLWRAMGPVRDGGTLAAALAATQVDLRAFAAADLPLRRRYALAAAMLAAALGREESRGAHWRRDFPLRDAGRDGPRAVWPSGPAPSAIPRRA